MNIIQHNAEIELFQKADLLSNQPREGLHCLFFKIPEKWDRINTILDVPFDMGHIAAMLTRTNGAIYHCGNREVFILVRGSLTGVEQKLAKYIGCVEAGSMSSGPHHNHFFTFNLARDWDAFYTLCKARYLRAIAEAEMAIHACARAAATPPAAAARA